MNAKGNVNWKPGVSANPAGRPKKPEEFKKHGPEAIKRLLYWMRSTNSKASMQATQLWLAYWLGKPQEFDPAALIPTVQNLINEQAVLKLLYAHNYSDRAGNSTGSPPIVATGSASLQAGAPTTNGL